MSSSQVSLPTLGSIGVVGAAYTVQGLVAGVGVLMIARLAQLQMPLETQVGILASGALPWALKFLGALALDLGPSWPTRIRGLVIGALIFASAGCLHLLAGAWAGGEAGRPGSLLTVAAIWVSLNLLLALQDVIVDGLALDTLADHRSYAAMAMGTGHTLGFGLLPPVLITPVVIDEGMSAGLSLPVPWLVALALVPVALLWRPGRPQKARDRRADEDQDQGPKPAELTKIGLALLAFVILMTAPNLTQAVSAELLFNELDWDYERYSELILPVGAFVGVIGALACGPLVARLGAGRAGLLVALGLGAAWLLFAGVEPLWTHEATILVLAGAEGLLQPALLVALHALALLAAARSPLPTTSFVLAMAALNLPRVFAPLLAPSLAPEAGALPWPGLFTLCGVLMIVGGLALWPLRSWGEGRQR